MADHCLEIARRWELRHVFAEADPANRRVLPLFLNRGFRAEPLGRDVTVFHKDLA